MCNPVQAMKHVAGVLAVNFFLTYLGTIGGVGFLTYKQNPCDYCGGQHVACNLTLRFQSNCFQNAQVEPMPQDFRTFMLDLHNNFRNTLASGGVPGFDPAIRMATLVWNLELEFLSLCNLLQCAMNHDKCRVTPDNPYAGQNLGYLMYRGFNFNNRELVTRLFNYWTAEYQVASMADILAYPVNSTDMIGHFTLLAQERANCVGCSMVSQISDTNIKYFFLACDYCYTNIRTVTVYRPGPAASACQSGTNPNYTKLCSVNEMYNTSTYKY